ncbi:MAG: hypothetical protein ABIQ70_14620 [Dokdonella sp.]
MSTIGTGHRGDFLTNVIDRAQERATVVAPRPASLFEPAVAPIRMDPEGADEAYPPRSVSVRDDAADALERIPLRAHSPDAVRGTPPAWPDGAASPAAWPVEPIHEMAVVGSVRPAPRASMSGECEDDSVPADTPIAPSLLVRNMPMLAPKRAPNSSASTENSRLPTSADAAAHYADDNQIAPGLIPRSRLLDEPDVDYESTHGNARNEDAAPAASLLPNHGVAATLRQQMESGREARREQMQQPAAAAIVTISIGRVEVRATPAAATPSNARAATAVKPTRLDEYLERKERKR